jgi:UDP-N-acetylmuramoylalanine--D-glutamate ligase
MTLVFGLGRSGLGVVRYLAQKGVPGHVYDDSPRSAEIEQAQQAGFVWSPSPRPGAYRQVIAAPGVPLDHPLLVQLAQSGAEVMGEAELAFRNTRIPIVGITGTAGKTSTTFFTAHLLRALGLDALEGGNFDPPLVSIIDQAQVAVAEMSSFQLERVTTFNPAVAVLLNLGIDHLDRHHTLEAYHQAKLNLVARLTPQQALVYNAADPRIVEAISHLPTQLYPFEPQATPRQTNLEAARLAATALVRQLGMEPDGTVLEQAIRTAPALEGRFDQFARKGDLVFIDDSIATRFDAVKAALLSAPTPIAWVLGGLDKGAPLVDLRPCVQGRVSLILAVGRDGPAMAQAFADLAPVEVIDQADGASALRQAVQTAMQQLPRGSLLLAPLGTSFDQFTDYKHRSRTFRQVVLEAGGEPWTAC